MNRKFRFVAGKQRRNLMTFKQNYTACILSWKTARRGHDSDHGGGRIYCRPSFLTFLSITPVAAAVLTPRRRRLPITVDSSSVLADAVLAGRLSLRHECAGREEPAGTCCLAPTGTPRATARLEGQTCMSPRRLTLGKYSYDLKSRQHHDTMALASPGLHATFSNVCCFPLTYCRHRRTAAREVNKWRGL
ncbi:hypothetical protein E2C01_024168 [Portunus trituberculatus]|uniref:Uncharacterized protein n=1 Tax=Portunus trituberculatus TaxID=210409 RepID=A0A5B7ECF7_PORTR|nr:hypothetical protein [Portunus trituberculatus]